MLRIILLGFLAGCVPGKEGWECDIPITAVPFGGSVNAAAASDCKTGLVCQPVRTARYDSTSAVCMDPTKSEVPTSYGWFHLMLFWILVPVIGIAILVGIIAKLRAAPTPRRE